MDALEQFSQTIALTMGAAWGSGVNLYATVLMLGIMHYSGSIQLPEGLDIAANPFILVAAGIMYAIEFFADKIPGIDSLWDSIHTFIRIPAGVALAYGAVSDLGPVAEILAVIAGGGMVTASHAAKAGSRVVINTSPEPFTNWTASTAEDASVFTGIWLAVQHPWVFLGLLLLFIALMIWLLPKIWRGIRRVFRFLFGSKNADVTSPALSESTHTTPANEGDHG